jgi:thioredoxin 1
LQLAAAQALALGPGTGAGSGPEEFASKVAAARQRLTMALEDDDGAAAGDTVIRAAARVAVPAHPESDQAMNALLKGSAADSTGSAGAKGPAFVRLSASSTAADAGSSAGRRKASPPAPAPFADVSVIDCFATWCGPCKQIAPLFEKLASATSHVSFVKMDGDKCRGATQSLGVRAFPTFIARVWGREVGRMEGADPNGLANLVKQATEAWVKTRAARPDLAKIGPQGGVAAVACAVACTSRDMWPEVAETVRNALATLN